MRTQIVKHLFEASFRPELKIASGTYEAKILMNKTKIDRLIAKNAPAWPLEQIAPIDMATLRLAIWELCFAKEKQPYKVVIDEAVEIAKEYGSTSSASFINGVLGSIVKKTVRQKVKN